VHLPDFLRVISSRVIRSTMCRLTAGRERRLPASKTLGGSDWPRPEVYSAAGLLQVGAPERSLVRTAASHDLI
jgi:hypothetical protein